jgi:broad-specificity NMP kinase
MQKNVKKMLDDSREMMKLQVIEQELSARSWKAYYEKMYYSLEAEKLEVPYKELQERMKAKRELEIEEMKKLQEELAQKEELAQTENQ